MPTPAVSDGMTGGKGDLQSPAATIIRPFLESLRRDAFVMEAFNYDSPAIAESEDFSGAFTHLDSQLRQLFGSDVFAMAAVDATGCWAKDRGGRHREVLCGIAHPTHGIRVFPKRALAEGEDLLRLAECSFSPSTVRDFFDAACPDLKVFLKKLGDPREAPTQVLCAPYIVQRVAGIAFPGLKYRDVLQLWSQGATRPALLHTIAEHHPVPETRPPCRDAYYSALLIVFVPDGTQLSPQHTEWLEALHISFQLSWGVPALEEKKRELARLQALETDMKQRAETFRKLQILAHEVSTQIHQHTSRLLRELDPGTELDKDQLGELFEPNSDREIWSGTDIIIRPQHEFNTRQGRNPRAIVYYALHLVLDKEPPRESFEELKAGAERLVNSQAASQLSPKFMPLLKSLLPADEKSFNLIKELARVHVPSGELRLYSLAVRLLLGPVRDDFVITIHSNEPITISGENYLDDDLFRKLTGMQGLAFPSRTNIKPGTWARPLVDLISRRLQTTNPDDRVYVASVDLKCPTIPAEPVQVLCHLKGPDSGLADVFEYLDKKSPSADWESHGLRSVLLRLHDCRSNRLRGYFDWTVEKELRLITFTIQGDR